MSDSSITKFNLLNVIKDDLKDITRDDIEILIDMSIDDGLLKDIPIIGNLFSVINISQKIKDWFFYKKIHKFLFSLASIENEKRTKFIEQIGNSNDKKKIGEELIFMIERLDHIEKSLYLGILFKAYILEEINYYKFTFLANVIDRIFISDLNNFLKYENIDRETQQRCLHLGLFYLSIHEETGVYGNKYVSDDFNITESGFDLKYILKRERNFA